MLHEAIVFRVIIVQRRAEDEGNLALAKDVAGFVLDLGLQPGIAGDLEAEGVTVEVRRLLGVADEELDVVNATQRKRVRDDHDSSRERLKLTQLSYGEN